MAKGRVLLVDADPEILTNVARGLRDAGCTVLTAPDALEAGRVVQSETLDVVITELDLPDSDGHSVAAHVRERASESETAVVYLSARAKETDFERAQKLGVARFLAKPCALAVLVAVVEDLIHQKSEVERA